METALVTLIKFKVKILIVITALLFITTATVIALNYYSEHSLETAENVVSHERYAAHGAYVANLLASDVKVEYIDDSGNIIAITKNNLKDYVIASKNIYIEKIEDNKVRINGSSKGAIAITGATSFISIGESLQLFSKISPSTQNQDVIWTSSNTSIATINSNGKVLGINQGQVTITATSKTDSNIKGYITIFVDSFVIDDDIDINFPGGGTGEDSGDIDPGSGLKIITITKLEEMTLNIVFKPAEVTNKEISWKSENPYIATVDNANKLVGHNIGKTKITATSASGNTQSILVKVVEPIAELSSLKIAGNNTLLVGDSTNLVVLFYPNNTLNKDVIWTSNNNSKATVDSTGKVIGVSAGVVTITATSKTDPNISATHLVNIVNQEIPVKRIIVKDANNKTSGNINSDADVQLFTNFIPENTTQGDVIWSSSDRGKITVDSNGLCTAKIGASGYVTITATSKSDQTIKGSYNFNVQVANVPVTGIRVVAPAYINTGSILNNVAPFQLEAIVLPSNATNKNVTWESNAPSVAAVDSYGNIIPRGSGVVTITCRSMDNPAISDSLFLIFIVPEVKAQSVYITGGRTPLNVKDVLYLGVNFNPANTTNKAIVWSVSNPEVISVTTTGISTAQARAVKNGWCRVYATTSNGIVAMYDITVNQEPIDWAKVDNIVGAFKCDGYGKITLPIGMPGVNFISVPSHQLYLTIPSEAVYIVNKFDYRGYGTGITHYGSTPITYVDGINNKGNYFINITSAKADMKYIGGGSGNGSSETRVYRNVNQINLYTCGVGSWSGNMFTELNDVTYITMEAINWLLGRTP